MEQRIVISQNLEEDLALAISECEHDRLFVLTDSVTREKCWPKISGFFSLRNAYVIEIGATDTHKDIDALSHVWKELGDHGATRHSCLVNLGGGMVTDLGGFAASTFKRGIDFINIPTTLLAMVDASVGGKTGINFNGLKNEVGVFNDSKFVLLNTSFLDTLDYENLCSGYGEMLKHGLISNAKMWGELLAFNLQQPDLTLLQRLVADSVKVKERIVAQDPFEKGIRKALNLGHTVGHAFEAWALKQQRPVLHEGEELLVVVARVVEVAVIVFYVVHSLTQHLRRKPSLYGAEVQLAHQSVSHRMTVEYGAVVLQRP